jgi:hypothetical protein
LLNRKKAAKTGSPSRRDRLRVVELRCTYGISIVHGAIVYEGRDRLRIGGAAYAPCASIRDRSIDRTISTAPCEISYEIDPYSSVRSTTASLRTLRTRSNDRSILLSSSAAYAIDRSIDRLFCLRRSAAYTIDRRPHPSHGFAPYASYTTDRSIDRSFCLLRNTAYTINRRSLRRYSIAPYASCAIDQSIDRSIDRSFCLRRNTAYTTNRRSLRRYCIAPFASYAIELHMLRLRSKKLGPNYGLTMA